MLSQRNEQWRTVLYRAGFTDQQIANMQGVSPDAVGAWRRKRNLTSNGRRYNFKRNCPPIHLDPGTRINFAHVAYKLAMQLSDDKTPVGAFKVFQSAID